jgi:hypothetical protein
MEYGSVAVNCPPWFSRVTAIGHTLGNIGVKSAMSAQYFAKANSESIFTNSMILTQVQWLPSVVTSLTRPLIWIGLAFVELSMIYSPKMQQLTQIEYVLWRQNPNQA